LPEVRKKNQLTFGGPLEESGEGAESLKKERLINATKHQSDTGPNSAMHQRERGKSKGELNKGGRAGN